MSSLEKCLLRFSVHILIVCCCCCWVVWTACIFWRFSPYLSHHLKIFFSHSISCHYGFFTVQNLVSLIRSPCIFCFLSIVLADWPKKTFWQFMSKDILPVFSSSLWYHVLYLSLSHLSLCLCRAWECVLISLMSMQMFKLTSTTCWRDFFPFYILTSFVED